MEICRERLAIINAIGEDGKPTTRCMACGADLDSACEILTHDCGELEAALRYTGEGM